MVICQCDLSWVVSFCVAKRQTTIKTARNRFLTVQWAHLLICRNSGKLVVNRVPVNYEKPRKPLIYWLLTTPVFIKFGGDGGIRTLEPRRANAFRVRPVMTTSIHLRICSCHILYKNAEEFKYNVADHVAKNTKQRLIKRISAVIRCFRRYFS